MTSRPNKKRVQHENVAQGATLPPVSVADGTSWRDRRQRLSTLTEALLAYRVQPWRLDLLLAALAVFVVAAPMLLTKSGFAVDFTNHLWLTWAAGKALVASGHPSYFLNARGVGVFYPWFAFYGGTLYMLTGGASEIFGGHPIIAYVGVTTLAIAGSYGGMLWFARQLGLRRWMSHAPALAAVTSAYYITNLYGRGAWTELMATSAIPPLLASGLWLARSSKWRPWPVLVFTASTILFSGSHNITLAWGSLVIALAATILWLASGASRRLPLRRIAMVAGLGLLGVAVNAWYLVPDLSYAHDVVAHLETPEGGAGAPFFDTPAVLLNPLRHVPEQSTTPALYVQIPIWFLTWSLLAGGLLLWRKGADRMLRRAWIGVAIVIGLVLAMIMITPFWEVVPYPFDEIQYPYRLGTYVLYGVGALVLVAGLAVQRATAGRSDSVVAARLRMGLLTVCAVSVGLCIWQEWAPETLFFEYSYPNRSEALVSPNAVPRTWYDPGSYRDLQPPLVEVPSGREMRIDPYMVHSDHFAAWVNAPAGMAPIDTNIAGGAYLVHISGVQRIGRDLRGYAVVRREHESSGPVRVTLETAHTTTIALARIVSFGGCVGLLMVWGWTCVSLLKARRREPSSA